MAIDSDIILNTDLFLVMTAKHGEIVGENYGIVPDKIKLLSSYLPERRHFDLGFFGQIRRGDDIPDPMGTPAALVKPVLDVLETACLESHYHHETRQLGAI